jgi:hypothetical protein
MSVLPKDRAIMATPTDRIETTKAANMILSKIEIMSFIIAMWLISLFRNYTQQL